MATLNISYPADAYNQLLHEELLLNSFIDNLLKGGVATDIIEHLTRYHSQNGDTCEINKFELTGTSYQRTQKTGTLQLSYLINYFYGCADITRQSKDHETWKFTVDEANNTLALHMPEYEVRSTHDEF